MRIILERRADPSKAMQFASPILAIVLSVIAFFVIFVVSGIDPLKALEVYFIEPLTAMWSIEDLIAKATPIILVAIGLCFCFRAGVWNIGAEGQLVAGAIAGSFVPIFFPDASGPFVLPAMLVLGMLGGMVYAAIPAVLKTRFGTNEILTSLMLVYVAQLFLDWLVRGPWRDPAAMNFPQAPRFTGYAILPELLPASGRANIGILFALIAAVLVWILLTRTKKGFEVRVIGMSPRAGRFAGFSTTGAIFFSFLLSGALAGLAGISEVSGAIGRLQPSISPGYGFAAIIVAFLGRLNPLGIIAAGLVLALTYLGGEVAQIEVGVSDKVVRAFQGLLLFFVLACDTLIHYRIRLTRPEKATTAVTEAKADA